MWFASNIINERSRGLRVFRVILKSSFNSWCPVIPNCQCDFAEPQVSPIYYCNNETTDNSTISKGKLKYDEIHKCNLHNPDNYPYQKTWKELPKKVVQNVVYDYPEEPPQTCSYYYRRPIPRCFPSIYGQINFNRGKTKLPGPKCACHTHPLGTIFRPSKPKETKYLPPYSSYSECEWKLRSQSKRMMECDCWRRPGMYEALKNILKEKQKRQTIMDPGILSIYKPSSSTIAPDTPQTAIYTAPCPYPGPSPCVCPCPMPTPCPEPSPCPCSPQCPSPKPCCPTQDPSPSSRPPTAPCPCPCPCPSTPSSPIPLPGPAINTYPINVFPTSTPPPDPPVEESSSASPSVSHHCPPKDY